MLEELKKVVDFLACTAGPEDMASVQINSSGGVIFRVGASNTEHLTLEEFCARIKANDEEQK